MLLNLITAAAELTFLQHRIPFNGAATEHASRTQKENAFQFDFAYHFS